MFLDLDGDCSGKSTQVHNGDYRFQKINNSHDLDTFDPLLNPIIYAT